MLDVLKTAWVSALRSGEYTQRKDYLELEGGFCCLGVLGDILHTAGCSELQDFGEELLRKDVLETVGMSYFVQGVLAKMNDEDYTFEQIAKWIASHDLQSGAPL